MQPVQYRGTGQLMPNSESQSFPKKYSLFAMSLKVGIAPAWFQASFRSCGLIRYVILVEYCSMMIYRHDHYLENLRRSSQSLAQQLQDLKWLRDQVRQLEARSAVSRRLIRLGRENVRRRGAWKSIRG